MATEQGQQPPPPEGQRAAVDGLTLAAVGVIATVLTGFIHEGLGHGLACVATGGAPRLLSSVSFLCDTDGLPSAAVRVVKAGGSLTNLLAAALFGGLLRTRRSAAPMTRYFLWLGMSMNVLQAGGYGMAASLFSFGDWALFIEGFAHPLLWRAAIFLVGAAISILGVRVAIRTLEPFVGTEPSERRRRAFMLPWIPYFVGGAVDCLAALRNPGGIEILLLSAAAASFGGNSLLLWLPMFMGKPRANAPASPPALGRDVAWLAAAVAAWVLLVAVLAPGVRLRQG